MEFQMSRFNRRWFLLAAALPWFGLVPAEAQAQATGTIRGTVIQVPSGQPLVAAQIAIVGTQRGTITGRDGSFQLTNVPTGQYELRAISIGFGSQTQSVTVVSNQVVTINFEMRESILDIDEIVVTGVAGETSRGRLPFTVERLTQASLPVPATNAANMIQGKVAGAIVTSPSGRPGSAPSILLRGPTSVNASGRSQDPLYIVDGVILAASVIDIDAMDIESIEIVKGAAAASLYGSRAANGVIQITTARGKNVAENSVRYSVRSEFGSSTLPGRFNLTQAHQFRLDGGQFVDQNGNKCDFVNCSSVQLAGQRRLGTAPAGAWNTIQQEEWPGQTYDHVDRFFQGGAYLNNSVSVAGRAGGTNYLVSFNRQDDEGILPFHDGSVRQSFRINVDQSVRSNLTISASAFYARSDNATSDGSIFQLTRMPAGVDLTMPDPRHEGVPYIIKPDPFNDNINPLYTMSTSSSSQNRGRYLGSLSGRWSPLSWFDIDGNFSFDRADTESESFRPKGFRLISGVPQGGSLSRSFGRIEGVNGSVTAQARRRFGDLATTSTIRYLAEQTDSYSNGASSSDFVAEGVWTFNNTPSANRSATSSSNSTRAEGIFFGTVFDYKNRYILDALVRQDGSSRFGPNERRSIYYRVGGAYVVSDEPWFSLPAVDHMKLSYSIGTAGNTPSFSAQYETYSVGSGAITPGTLGNRNLKPEFVTEQEFGIETLLFDRVSVDLTYATSRAEDQILLVPALSYTGFANQWRNAGTLESNTFEATINSVIVRRRDFSWSARLLFDRTKQEITELNVPAYQSGVDGQGLGSVFFVRAGEAMGTFYGFKFAEKCSDLPSGVDCSQFQVNDDGFLVWVGGAGSWQNGWDTYVDGNGATRAWWGTTAPFTIRGQALTWGTPFQAEGIDRVTGEVSTFLPLGKTLPDYTISLANTFNWKGFTVYGLLQSLQGFSVYNQPLQWATFQSYSGIMDQRNVPENLRKPVGYYDRLYGASGLQPSSAFVDDASFIKLRELSVRYRVPRNFMDRTAFSRGIENLSLSVTGRNLLTWTDYDGYDPDVGSTGGGPGSAALARVDGFSYPNFRTVTFGFEINF
jgi:TonB-linked SusC/RagA family outer membrane protein